MRLKHNKKRNTAFVYETLVRELTESVVKNNKNKQNKIVSILREHFKNESTLKKELDLYKSIYETRDVEKETAEKIVVEVKQRHANIDSTKLFQEQSALINKINRTLSRKVYSNFVPNYKTMASVYSIFQDTLPVKDRILLEENIVQQMSSSVETEQENQKPMDSLIYKTFVGKFNEEYSDLLSEGQKKLLNHYISSFSDNGLELKVFINEEIGRLKKEILDKKRYSSASSNQVLKEKLEQVYNILDKTKEKSIDTETIEIVLNTQQLLDEMSNDG